MAERHILVVSPVKEEARRLAIALGEGNSAWRVGWSAAEAAVEKILAVSRVDALVADGALPEMSQSKLLQTASRYCPAAFRLALSGNFDPGMTLCTMGFAHQNLWKPCAASDIAATLARAFALRDMLQNDRLQLLIAQIDSLPSLPRLYLEFLDEVRRPNPSIGRLAEIIRQDLGLCAKILQLVNSAFFGLPHKIDNPGEALLYLGMENVRAMVLSIQVFSLFDKAELAPFSLETLWDHSWRVGGLARSIAAFERQSPETIETAFTAGLLHDVGKLILAGGVPRSWRQVQQLRTKARKPGWEMERDCLGATHADVGAALLAMWGLSDEIVEAVAYHHEPQLSGRRTFCPLAAVHAANLLVHDLPTDEAPRFLQGTGAAEHLSAWHDLAVELAA